MKKILKKICQFFEVMAQARAATALARMGKIKEVKALYAK